MKTLNHKQLDEKIESNDNAIVINVLSAEYFEKQHIPGSINIPYDDPSFVEKVQNKTSGKDQEIVVYCANAECSASDQAYEKLEKAGFNNVYDFKGGMEEWKDNGHKVKGTDCSDENKGSCGTSSCS